MPFLRLLATLALALALTPAALPAVGAEAPPAEPDAEAEEESFDVYLDEDEEADRLLRLAARYAASKKWRACLEKYLECIRLYGHRLTRAGGEDRDLFESVRAVVLREMARTPREGREIWRVLMAGRFERRLRAALAAGADPDELAAIAGDFAGLEFAPRALLLLGEARYARGDPAGAVHAWRRLLREYPEGDYPRIRVLGRAGLVAAEAGLELQAQGILARLRAESALAEVSAGGRTVRLADAISERLKARRSAPGAGGVDSWSVMGGDGTHCRPAPPLPRPTVLRWRRELPVPSGWKGSTASHYLPHYMRTPQKKGWPFPAYHPAACGELLLLAGELGVMAFRAHDGDLVWSAPAGEKGVGNSCGLAGPMVAGGLLVARQGRIQSGPVYAGRPSPGGRSELLLMRPRTGKPAGAGGAIESPPEIPREDEEDEPEEEEPAEGGDVDNAGAAGRPGVPQGERRTTFVGIPALAGGVICCGLVRQSTHPEYEMAGFDPSDGRLLWRTFLCGAQPVRSAAMTMWGRGGGGLLAEIGQPPAAAGRTVFAVTNLGAVAALDSDDGTVKWLRLYPRYAPAAKKRADPRMAMLGRAQVEVLERDTADMWEACAPVLTAGLLVCAPQDSDHLLALDPESGRLVWRAPRAGLRRLVGAVESRIVLTGRDQVVVRDAGNGKAVWRRRLSARVIGHAAIGAGYVAVSTAKALEVLSLEGKPLFTYKWKDPKVEAGNVLVRGENVYTVSATHVNAYCDMEQVARRLAARGKEDPGSALPHFLTGALELAADRRDAAVKSLLRALELAGPDQVYAGAGLRDAIGAKLWQCHWGAYREAAKAGKSEDALARLDAALKYAAGPERAPRTLLARARCLAELKRPSEALDAYRKLMTDHPEAPCERDDGSRLRAWLLAKGEVAALIAGTGPEIYAAHEKRAAELLARAKESRSYEEARKLADLYPNSTAARQALLLAAETAAAAGRHDAELRCLRRQVFLGAGRPEGNAARARLAEAYARLGYLEAARRVASELAAATGKFSRDGAETTAAEFLAGRPELTGTVRPPLDPPLAEKWRLKLRSVRLVPGCAADRQLIVLGSEGDDNNLKIYAVDAETGRRLWSFDTVAERLGALNRYYRGGPGEVRVDGDAVVLSIGVKRAVLDRATGKVRWRTELHGAAPRVYYGGTGAVGGDRRYSCSDGVMACLENAAKVNQLGHGDHMDLVRAFSVDDGRELWTVLVAKSKQTATSARPVYYYGRGKGLARAADGRFLAWRQKQASSGSRRSTPKASTMVINAVTGIVAARFDVEGTPLGLFGSRLICRDNRSKVAAYSPAGKKAWAATGQWNQLAASPDGARLVLSGSSRSSRGYSQQLAAMATAGGKLLWKTATGASRLQFTAGGVTVLREKLIAGEGVMAHWYHRHYAGRRAKLKVWDLAGGKFLWETPFIPAGHSRAAGAKHLACGFAKYEHLDEKGRVVPVKRDRFGRMQPAGGQQPAAARETTILRLFDLAGGKAVWQWTEVKTGEPAGAVVVRSFSPLGAVGAVRGGLLVTSHDSAVLLAPVRKPAGAPPAGSKPSATKP
ncbi:MAG: outer membrane protein assembly factor BamB family protein [Planctomycetota bacterium]